MNDNLKEFSNGFNEYLIYRKTLIFSILLLFVQSIVTLLLYSV